MNNILQIDRSQNNRRLRKQCLQLPAIQSHLPAQLLRDKEHFVGVAPKTLPLMAARRKCCSLATCFRRVLDEQLDHMH